jgi:hypothetical protein
MTSTDFIIAFRESKDARYKTLVCKNRTELNSWDSLLDVSEREKRDRQYMRCLGTHPLSAINWEEYTLRIFFVLTVFPN